LNRATERKSGLPVTISKSAEAKNPVITPLILKSSFFNCEKNFTINGHQLHKI
jgi:hypothetical protein